MDVIRGAEACYAEQMARVLKKYCLVQGPGTTEWDEYNNEAFEHYIRRDLI